jgi:hypothetical protein
MRFLVGLFLLVLVGCAAPAPVTDPSVPVFTPQAAPGDVVNSRPVPPKCDELATLTEIKKILATLITGQTLPIVGIPQENIGRTARLDCYYGVPAGQPVAAAAVWIGLTSYTDAESARDRLENTVTGEIEAGATESEVDVGPTTGTLLAGARPVLVALRGTTTVVVATAAGLIRDDHAGALLGQLADLALTPREPTG